MAKYNKGGWRVGRYRASLTFKGNQFITSTAGLFIVMLMGDMVFKALIAGVITNIDNSTFKQAFNIMGITMQNSTGGTGAGAIPTMQSTGLLGVVGVILCFGLITSFISIQRV